MPSKFNLKSESTKRMAFAIFTRTLANQLKLKITTPDDYKLLAGVCIATVKVFEEVYNNWQEQESDNN